MKEREERYNKKAEKWERNWRKLLTNTRLWVGGCKFKVKGIRDSRFHMWLCVSRQALYRVIDFSN